MKEGDFYRLFFTQEGFAAGSKFVAKPWPPVVEVKGGLANAQAKTVSYFEDAEKPFLFWKIEERASQEAKDLAQVKDQVITAWKMEKAKEQFALAKAKEIADKLEKSGGDLMPLLRVEARKLGAEPIYLDKLSPLHPDDGMKRRYGDYPLRKEFFQYPRPDLLKQLLAVTGMEKPLQIDYKALDDPNKKLFEAYKKNPEVGKKIQILTNLPKNTFYVAAVVASPGADMADFALAYKRANGDPRNPLAPMDDLIDIFQRAAGKEFRQAFISSLREAMKYQKDFTEDDRKNFDAGN